MADPKYKVGDVLDHVAFSDVGLFVVEVKSQTCPGGTQIWYACRIGPRRGNISLTLAEFNEIELIPHVDPAEKAKAGWESVIEWMNGEKMRAVDNREFEVAATIREVADKLQALAK